VQIATGSQAAPPPPGRVISIDREAHISGTKHKVGGVIPDSLKVELVTSDIVLYLTMDSNFYELIYEDTAHTFEVTQALYNVAINRLPDGGVIISHDACHPKFKGAVVNGIRACGIEPEVYLVEGDSCGLAIWQKPEKTDKQFVTELEQQIHSPHSFAGLPEDLPERPDSYEEIPEEEEAPSPIHIKNPPKRKRRKSTKRKVKEETSL